MLHLLISETRVPHQGVARQLGRHPNFHMWLYSELGERQGDLRGPRRVFLPMPPTSSRVHYGGKTLEWGGAPGSCPVGSGQRC